MFRDSDRSSHQSEKNSVLNLTLKLNIFMIGVEAKPVPVI